ncbi:hypothetical protein ES705_37498 [subsurface metagenome]
MSNSESNQEFKIGDTVQLKSGGPSMTIVHSDGKGLLKCSWFTQDDDEVREGIFPLGSLKLRV